MARSRFFYDALWVLPTAGFAVGWFTNWIALKIIFQPIRPVRLCCGYELQGIFLKRQKEVSAVFARVVSVVDADEPADELSANVVGCSVFLVAHACLFCRSSTLRARQHNM
jgi:hypothetical protein